MQYGPETFFVRMADDSMAPTVARGGFAFVDSDEPMAVGRLVGVDDPEGGETTVRRLVTVDGRRFLRAEDGLWPELEIGHHNETLIRGTVVFVGKGV